jgi:hypothetical protein
MSPLGRDPAFDTRAQGVRKGSNNLIGWLEETWIKRWPTMSEFEMLDLVWFRIEKGFKGL